MEEATDMARFILEINIDNDAFDGPGEREMEIARILRVAASRVNGGLLGGTQRMGLSDINGNKVGSYGIEEQS